MPVRDSLKDRKVRGESVLLAELKAELTDPKKTGEPDIVIERPNVGTVHLYVIWSKWKDLEQRIRSRIILEAYERVKGDAESLKVTVAMGLTRKEADSLGVK